MSQAYRRQHVVAFQYDQTHARAAGYRAALASDNDSGESGFTVLEVVIALAILSLSLTVLFNVITQSLWNTARAETLTRTAILAQSLIERVGTELPVQDGSISGETKDGLRWRLNIKGYGGSADLSSGPVAVYNVIVDVQQIGSATEPTVLATLRLGPQRGRQ